jgi:hypothetical protein
VADYYKEEDKRSHSTQRLIGQRANTFRFRAFQLCNELQKIGFLLCMSYPDPASSKHRVESCTRICTLSKPGYKSALAYSEVLLAIYYAPKSWKRGGLLYRATKGHEVGSSAYLLYLLAVWTHDQNMVGAFAQLIPSSASQYVSMM